MSFERARSKENKEIRFKEIKEAAIKLFDQKTFDQISLSDIGKEINFTRANLYKYISSKEDIYLMILIDEFESVAYAMNKDLQKERPLNTEDFCTLWAKILCTHERFLRLLSLLFSTIEQNAKMDVLVAFKNALYTLTSQIFILIKHNFKAFSDEEINQLINLSFALVIGTYPLCTPTDKQIEALNRSDYEFVFTPLEVAIRSGLITLFKGVQTST